MLDILLWFLVTGPYFYAVDTKNYIIEGLLRGQTRERWELERHIKTQHKLLTYFESCSMYDESKADIYDKTCEDIIKEIERLKSFRLGERKVKMLP